jgi:hypothetical protein
MMYVFSILKICLISPVFSSFNVFVTSSVHPSVFRCYIFLCACSNCNSTFSHLLFALINAKFKGLKLSHNGFIREYLFNCLQTFGTFSCMTRVGCGVTRYAARQVNQNVRPLYYIYSRSLCNFDTVVRVPPAVQ